MNRETGKVDSVGREVKFVVVSCRVYGIPLNCCMCILAVGVQACAESHSTDVQTDRTSTDEQSTQTILQTFSDSEVQTESYCRQTEAQNECTVSDTRPSTVTPVMEHFEVQQTAMLHSETPDEDSQNVDDSEENVHRNKLADVEARVLELESLKRNLMGTFVLLIVV